MSSTVYPQTEAGIPGPEVEKYASAFAALQILGGQIGLPLVLLAMLFGKNMRRHPILINFCITWVIFSVNFCILVYTGQEHEYVSDTTACFMQAVMIHGAIPMTVTATCALVVQVWLGLQYPDGFSKRHGMQMIVMITMLTAPYLAYLIFAIIAIAIAAEHPELVNNLDSYYCTIRFRPLVYAVPGFAAAVVAVAIGFIVAIVINLLQQRRRLRGLNHEHSASMSMLIRIGVFCLYGFITLGACAGFLSSETNAAPWLIEASLPLAVFIVFGLRRDILLAWCFWRKTSTNFADLSSPVEDSKTDIPPAVPPKDASIV